MPYVTKEEIERAREVSLLSYLQANKPDELIQNGPNAYRMKTHSSLTLSNGKWCWFGGGRIGGSNALDYLMKVEQLPFPDAVREINGGGRTYAPTPKTQAQKEFILPARNENNKRVTAYLLSRGIDIEILDYCYQKNLLYEDAAHHNAVFVGYDKNTPKYATLRGATTGNKFKGEVSGSSKAYGFSVPAQTPSDSIHVFESAIDAISFLTLVKVSGRDWRSQSVLSLGGVSVKQTDRGVTLPTALSHYLSTHAEVQRVVLRLDNDQTGRAASVAIRSALKDKIVSNKQPKEGKDYNEYLMMKKGLTQQKKQHDEPEL